MKKLIVLSITVCLLQMTFGCASPDDKSAGSSSSSSTSPGAPNPTASEAAPLVLQISTKYDQASAYYPLTFQETQTTSCSATSTSPTVTCTVVVPEGRLYYSSVVFSYSWRNDKCKLMNFAPYFYSANNASAAYNPPWLGDATADCSKGDWTKNEAGCFGGAAPYLVPGFPKYDSLIYLSDPTTSTPQTHELTLPSAYSLAYRSNRLSSNDLPAAKQGNDYAEGPLGVKGDSYVGSDAPNTPSMQSYEWTCKDDWYDPVIYQINLVITDEDTSGSGPNTYRTWKEL
jgi:hypothetical protein